VGPSGFIVSDSNGESTITSVTRAETTGVSSSYEDSTTVGGGLGLTYGGANLGISRNWSSRNSSEKSSSLTRSTSEQSVVSSTAQFTPKTVETASERQKMMFRVKAQIDRELLHKHFKQVKTGLPGIAWLKIDPNASWPESLQFKVPE
jgi:hypothetical protein